MEMFEVRSSGFGVIVEAGNWLIGELRGWWKFGVRSSRFRGIVELGNCLIGELKDWWKFGVVCQVFGNTEMNWGIELGNFELV